MDTNELTAILEEGGLSPYQATAYMTLLSTGAIPARELADEIDLPVSRIYDVLDGLKERGYVITYERDQLYAEALAPTNGLDTITSHITQQNEAEAEIRSRWAESTGYEIDISVVRHFRTVLEHTRELIGNADQRILLALTYDQFLKLESALESAADRGVRSHVLLHLPREDEADEMEGVSFREVAAEVRLADVAAMYEPFLAIVDGAKVSFAPCDQKAVGRPDDTPRADGTMSYGALIADPIQAYVFEWYFLAALWEPSEPLYTARSSSPPMEFIRIREAIRAVEPLLWEGAVVNATVRGRAVETGQQVSVRGEITSVRTDTSAAPEKHPRDVLLTRHATIVLRTDEGEVSVGGLGAYTEDIEAERIVITDVGTNGDADTA